ncbi:MAG: hypothetical protein ACRC20_12315 [Segniliparus sp.]|uniref:hypothetical protein n=1 Tax=Segniliparus sp. TaxID=2804064 RepID=UPI003F39CDEB
MPFDPPPDNPWSPDRPVFNSLDGFEEQVRGYTHAADVAAIRLAWASLGWTFANHLLDFYMMNRYDGQSYQMTSDEMSMVLNASPKVGVDDPNLKYYPYDGQNVVDVGVQEIVRSARERCLDNPREFEYSNSYKTDWIPTRKIIDGIAGGNLGNALGGFYMGVSGEVVVHKPRGGQPMSYEAQYVVYVYDQYYFHGTAKGQGYLSEAMDIKMRFLEESGFARSFTTRGASPIQTKQGVC